MTKHLLNLHRWDELKNFVANYESAFSLALRPKDLRPNSCSFVDWALIYHS